MARGMFSGVIWGVVVAGLGAGTASVVTGPVFAPQPGAPSGEPAVARLTSSEPDAVPTRTPDAPRVGVKQSSPGLPAEPSDTQAPDVESASAPVPATTAVDATPDAPEAIEDAAVRAPQDEPVQVPQTTDQPAAPGAEELSISTSPAQPAAPVTDEATPDPEDTPLPEIAPVVANDEVQLDALDTTADAPTAAGDTSPISVTTQAPASPELATDAEDTASGVAALDDEVASASPAIEPETEAPQSYEGSTSEAEALAKVKAEAAPTLVEETDLAEGITTEEATAEADTAPAQPRLPTIGNSAAPTTPVGTETQVAMAVEEPETAPQLGSGATDLTKLAPGIKTSRLPSVQSGEAAPGDAPRPPLERFAVAPARAPDKPLMSIVLIDDGDNPVGLEALEAFPYPITFAVDTEWSDAAAATKRYRDAGFEVMALANIPQAARATDVEVALSAALDSVPEAVAVLEGDRSGLQGSREVSDQVADILADTGHGLVLYPKGLNTAVSLAQRAGVPTSSLFRDFDGQGQNATVIRRFLDQAAFKAGQEGAVIMLGRLRADTISALLIWGLQDRADRVSFVPVSAVLTRSGG